MPCDCLCSVTFPCDAVSWYAVCEYGISNHTHFFLVKTVTSLPVNIRRSIVSILTDREDALIYYWFLVGDSYQHYHHWLGGDSLPAQLSDF